MSKFAPSARKPKPNVACRRARLAPASELRYQAIATTNASSSHCPARARRDDSLTTLLPGRRGHHSTVQERVVQPARQAESLLTEVGIIILAVVADVLDDAVG